MLSGLKIGPRLACGFGAVLLFVVSLWTLSAADLDHAWQSIDQSIAQHEKTVAMAHARSTAWSLRWDDAQLDIVTEPAARKAILDRATAARQAFEQAVARFERAGGTVEREESEQLRQLVARFQRYWTLRLQWLELASAGKAPEAARLRDEQLLAAGAEVLAGATGLLELEGKLALAVDAAAYQELRDSRVVLHAAGTTALVLAALMAWLLTRSITRPLRQAVGAVEVVARGDLTQRVPSGGRDEVGDLLRALATMQQSLRTLVGEVMGSAQAVADASSQIAQGNLDLSQRTEEQASTLEETAGSMEELTATVTQNADHARQASQLAAGASGVADRGGEVVGQVVRTMEGISASSRRIAEIIGVIDGIAFQTNILALNASVEAARAGDQGRGFAVVAGEVRNLAQRSAAAAGRSRP